MQLETITLNTNTPYHFAAVLYKDNIETGIQIPWYIMTSIKSTETMDDVFESVVFSFQSRGGYSVERVSDPSAKTNKTLQNPASPYTFNVDLDNKVFLYLAPIDTKANKDTYPIYNCVYAIANKIDSNQMDLSDANSKIIENNTTTLKLIPKIQQDMINSSMQWTTTHDYVNLTELHLGNESGMFTGEAIKDILKKFGITEEPSSISTNEPNTNETDNYISKQFFDNGSTRINLTSIAGMSVLNTIDYIMNFHTASQNADRCYFKYDSIKRVFTLRSLTNYMQYDQTVNFDHDGFFDKVILPSPSLGTSSNAGIGSTLVLKYNFIKEQPYTSLMSNSPIVVTTHRKNTFVIDGTAVLLKNQDDFIKKNYTGTQSNPFNQIPDKDNLVSPYPDDGIIDKYDMVFTPHYKKNERSKLGIRENTTNKTYNSMIFNCELVGLGGYRGCGRSFSVLMTDGAIDNYTKSLLGIYFCLNIDKIIYSNGTYTEAITGIKPLMSKEYYSAVN